ncbi:MAG TPA: LuxR C-terminal-related transcriptional regulator [bacterium]|nr:LuxR C-terminal-related transcriptional regulator [bacterium]
MLPLEKRARRKIEERSGSLCNGHADHPHLSAREREVLDLVADGLTNKAIAARLGISANTVANHLQHVLEKSGTANRTEAVLLARRLGLIE